MLSIKNIFHFQNEAGFTIQELLVVLLVSSILIAMCLSLFLFTDKLFKTWYGSSELKNDANRILYQWKQI